jgi:zinc protease
MTPSVTFASAAAPVVFTHKGRPDQALFGEYFALPDYFSDPKASAIADVAASILSTRLVDTVREKLGMTYSPMVQADSSVELKGEGYFTAAIETPQANFAAFRALLSSQIKDLATKPVSSDELARAKQPLIEGLRKQQETNDYWVNKLTQLAREPRTRRQIADQLASIQQVTVADVQALTAKYLSDRQPLVAIAKAKGSEAVPGTGGNGGVKPAITTNPAAATRGDVRRDSSGGSTSN